MSFSEQDNRVILSMSREDYQLLLCVFAGCTKLAFTGPMGNLILGPEKIIGLLNRLNEGNPNYMPYQTGEPK